MHCPDSVNTAQLRKTASFMVQRNPALWLVRKVRMQTVYRSSPNIPSLRVVGSAIAAEVEGAASAWGRRGLVERGMPICDAHHRNLGGRLLSPASWHGPGPMTESQPSILGTAPDDRKPGARPRRAADQRARSGFDEEGG